MRTSARTAALAALGLLLAGCGGQSPTPGAGQDPPAAPASGPDAPDGRRWVGIGGLVGAVPRGWETVAGVCASPRDHQVAIQADGAAAVRCARIRTGQPAITLSPPGSLGWSPGSGVRCRASTAGPCSALVEDSHAAFRVTYRGPRAEQELRALLASATTAPEGWMTVPAVDYGTSDHAAVRQLAEMGLVGVPPDVDWTHYVVGTDPAVGTLVAEGSEVALVPGDG